MSTQLPTGIGHTDTVQGVLYYTRDQLIDYGQRCAVDFMAKIDQSRMRHNSSGQTAVDTEVAV